MKEAPRVNFFFGIEWEEDEKRIPRWRVNWINNGVPTETFLMNMKSFVDLHEKAYKSNFMSRAK